MFKSQQDDCLQIIQSYAWTIAFFLIHGIYCFKLFTLITFTAFCRVTYLKSSERFIIKKKKNAYGFFLTSEFCLQ